MGMVDLFKADATVEIKVSELYEFMKVAADNGARARYLMNGVRLEVPYKHIREIITGEPETESFYNPPLQEPIKITATMREKSEEAEQDDTEQAEG